MPTGEGAMRRIWGELVSLDLATRTGKFRNESNDQVMSFTVLPYAELLHHAAFGDLQDFRIGTRAIFRLHENEAGDWVWLTYIQDQMNMMNGHKEYFYVDSIDADKGTLTCTQANFDKSFVREKGILISTDAETKYWKDAQPAKFADIKVGDKIRTETHGVGKGKVQMCWNVFLDDESLLKFQNEQKAVEAKRLQEEGSPGYVDKLDGDQPRSHAFLGKRRPEPQAEARNESARGSRGRGSQAHGGAGDRRGRLGKDGGAARQSDDHFGSGVMRHWCRARSPAFGKRREKG